MKTFTTYAEKKAKQILNLLQGYTKGIRMTAILILLLMGVSNAWAGNDFTQGVVVYFDNTVTQWSSIYLRVGHSTYSSAYQVTSKVSGTDALYKYTLPSWGGYDAFSFANKSGRTGGYTIYQPSNYKYNSNYPSGQTTYFSGWDLNKRRLFIPKSVSNTENGCTYYNTDIEYDNYQRTVTITSPTNGTITVTYTNESNTSESKNSGNFKVAQTCILTINATPSTGYQLNKLYIGDKEITSGSTYIVRSDVTISAEFVTANPQVVYLKPTSNWNADNPKFVVHAWNNSSSKDITMEAIGCASKPDYYTCTIPAGYHAMLFYRKNTAGTTIWNQTNDLTIPVNSDNICYTISSTGNGTTTKANGSWGTYSAPSYEITLNPTVGGLIQVTPTGGSATTSNISVTVNTKVKVTLLPNTGYATGTAKIKIGSNSEETLVDGQEYEICANTTITAEFIPTNPTPVYLKVADHNWKNDNAWFAIYWWNSSGNGWSKMTAVDCNGDYYYGEVAASAAHFVFVRLIPEGHKDYKAGTNGDGMSWDNDWAQTEDLLLPEESSNLYTVGSKSGEKYTGSWSTYTPPTYEITLSPRIGGTITTDPVSPVEVNTEVTVTITPSTGYAFRSGSIKIGTNEATNITQTSSTHTICGPTEITAEFVTAGEQVVYLKPTSQWKGDKPTFAVHVWNNGGDATARDIPMTAIDCNGDYYTATIPAGFHSMVFYRKSTDGTTVWNQTADLVIPTDNNNCYTITSTGSKNPFTAAGGNWGTYTEPKYAVTINAPESGTIKVTIGGVTTTVTSEAKTISNVALNAQMDVLFEPATGYKLGKAIIQIGNNEKASAAGTYTVCGPTEITAYFVTEEDQIVYLRPNDNWLADDARFAAYAFNRYAGTDASQWIELTTKENDYTGAFSGTIPAGHSHVIFVRINPEGTSEENNGLNWDNDWNQTINYSIPTDGTNDRFLIGNKKTSGEDTDKYEGTWEASKNPIYGIPGDWQNEWAAADYPLMGPNGQTTVHITQTNDTLGFKVYHYPYGSDDESAQWLGNDGTMIRGNSSNWVMTTAGGDCGLGVDIADNYVFNFDIRTKQLTVTYPKLPAPNAITASAQRVFEESVLTWVAGNGTEANPYQLYIDETARFTVTPLTEVAGLTAYYRFGHYEEQTANSFDFTEINTKDTTLTVIAYYKNAMGSTSDTVTTQTPYILGVKLPFYLMTDPSGEINIDRVAAGENILVQFRSDAAATVGLYVKKNDEATETKITDITSSTSYDYTYDVANDIEPCILHFIAKSTETVHGRTFEATANVAIYKNVIIKVNDPEGWVKNAYMWRDGSGDVLTPWPGDPVLQNFGSWRVFSVKYPYYDRFIVNAGAEGTQQTIDWILPSDDTCYELLDPEDAGKYGLQVAECPGNLIVGDLQDTTIYVSDQIVVIPSIALGLGYSTSDLTPSVTSSNTTAVTATMSGMNITIIGNAEGESTITVTYTLVTGEKATKTFKVTVEKNTNITIQVKVPINFGDGDSYQWVNNDGIYIRYWGTGIDGTNLNMTYLYTDETHKYAQAQIPLGTDGEINFHFFYEYIDNNNHWRQTTNITNVNQSGCYLVKKDGSDYYRGYQHNGQNCANSYQIKILMANGKTYTSNTVSAASETLSFFAPGKNETGYKAGAVMLYYNNKMVATIAPAKFETSGVYTANLHDTKDDITNVAPYTGNYYIRTYGDNDWGQNTYQQWSDDQRSQRKFTYFVPREEELYNHYWVDDLEYYSGGKDVSGYVANIYNNDLAGKLVTDHTGTTDENGKIYYGSSEKANVRFGYDPRTNYFCRAILKGSGESVDFLNLYCATAYQDEDCTELVNNGTLKDSKLDDASNWVYEKEFYVPITNTNPTASVYLSATAYNSARNLLLGYEVDEITGEEDVNRPKQRTIIGSGTANATYHMRLIYDFKTNRLITAWEPQDGITFTDETTIHSDMLIIRHENDTAPQINLTNAGKVKSLETMYFALEFERGNSDVNYRHQEQYWFTLPFNCRVGEISGVPGYMQIWGIQRYRGDIRAKIGWFEKYTSTFWEWLSPNDTLKAGEGYLLVFDKKAASWEEFEVRDDDGNVTETRSILRLYFPSITSGFDLQQQSESDLTRTYENHTCTITAGNRYLQDSNWKVIGTTSYNNAGITGCTADTNPTYEELTDAPSFRYKYEYTMSDDNTTFWYKYTAEDGKEATYNSFFGYMVQFAGTIQWQPIMSETVPEGIAARRYVPANERTSFTTRLEIADAANEMQDQTFIALDEKATVGFDQNKDLNKVLNRGTNIYTFAQNIPFAGNTLPMEEVTVPVGVQVATAGEYTFRMPDGTDGISAILVDYQTGERTDMLLDEYTVTLNAGTCNDRFALILDPQRSATSVENINGESGEAANSNEATGAEKFIIDGKLIIRTADGIFDAQGHRL